MSVGIAPSARSRTTWQWQPTGSAVAEFLQAGKATTGNASTTMPLEFPSETKAGDQLVLVCLQQTTSIYACDTPAGWTASTTNPLVTGGPGLTLFMFYRTAVGTEGGTTLTLTGVPTSNKHGQIYRFKGDGIESIGGFASTSSADTTIYDVNVTSTAVNALGVNLIGINADTPLRDFSGANIHTTGTFESNTVEGWTADSWVALTTLAAQSGWSHSGTYSLRITVTDGNVTERNNGARSATGTSGFAVTPDTVYTLRADINVQTAANGSKLGYYFYDSAGAIITSGGGSGYGNVVTGTGTKTLSLDVRTPPYAAYMSVGVYGATIAANPTWDAYVDDYTVSPAEGRWYDTNTQYISVTNNRGGVQVADMPAIGTVGNGAFSIATACNWAVIGFVVTAPTTGIVHDPAPPIVIELPTQTIAKYLLTTSNVVESFVKRAGKTLSATIGKAASLVATYIPAGGGVTNKTLTATVTNTTSFIKNVGKILTLSNTTATSDTERIGKNQTATASNTASTIKQAGKNLTATVSNSLSAIKSARAIRAVTASSTVTYLKNVSKIITTTVGSSLSSIKQATKNPSATVGNATTALKRVGKNLSATVSNSSTLATLKAFGVTLTTTVSNTPSIARKVSTNITRAVTSTPTFVKAITKTVPTVTVGSISTFIKQAGKLLSTSVNESVNYLRNLGKTTATTVGNSPSMVKQAGKRLTATVGNTPTYLRGVAKNTNTAVGSSVSYVKGVGKILTTTVSNSSTILAARFYLRTLTATVGNVTTLAALATTTTLKTLTATVGNTTTLVKQARKNLTVTSAMTLTWIRSVTHSVTATASNSTSLIKQARKNLSVTLSGAVATAQRRIGKPISVVSSTTSSFLKAVSKTTTASVSGAASFVRQTKIVRSAASSVIVIQLVSLARTFTATVAGSPTMLKQVGKVVSTSITGSASFKRLGAITLRVTSSIVATLVALKSGAGPATVQIVMTTTSNVVTNITTLGFNFLQQIRHRAFGTQETNRNSGGARGFRGRTKGGPRSSGGNRGSRGAGQ